MWYDILVDYLPSPIYDLGVAPATATRRACDAFEYNGADP
jgi:hypothetical protein